MMAERAQIGSTFIKNTSDLVVIGHIDLYKKYD